MIRSNTEVSGICTSTSSDRLKKYLGVRPAVDCEADAWRVGLGDCTLEDGPAIHVLVGLSRRVWGEVKAYALLSRRRSRNDVQVYPCQALHVLHRQESCICRGRLSGSSWGRCEECDCG